MNTADNQLLPFFLPPLSPFSPPAILALMRLQKLAGLENQTATIVRLISSYEEISRTEGADGVETEHSSLSPYQINENQPIDLRCSVKREKDEQPMKFESRKTRQINILLEIHHKLQQLNNTKIKLNLLKKEKKRISRDKQRIKHLREQLKRGKTTFNCNESMSTNVTQSTASPSSSVGSVSPKRKPSIWRPIEFPSSPPLSESSPVSETMVNTQFQQTMKQEQSYSPRISLPATSVHNQRLTSNHSFVNEMKQNIPPTSPALPPSPSSSSSSSSSSSLASSNAIPAIEQLPCDENGMVTIGPNGTKIPKASLMNINWSLKETYIIRKLLMEVFDRDTLALHNLSGKPSPAFFGCNKPLKGKLDPLKVADFVHIITRYLKITEKEVRQTITIKCADENKRVRNELMRVLGKGRDNARMLAQT